MKSNNTIEEPMAKTATVKLRLDQEKRDRIKQIARHEDRSMSYVIEKAIDERLAYEEYWANGVAKAIAEADSGMGIPDNEVEAWVRSLGTDKPLPKPEARKLSV